MVGTTVAERILYLPSLGISIIYGMLLDVSPYIGRNALNLEPDKVGEASVSDVPMTTEGRENVPENRPRNESFRRIAFVFIFATMGQACIKQNHVWTNQLDLWAAAFSANPHR